MWPQPYGLRLTATAVTCDKSFTSTGLSDTQFISVPIWSQLDPLPSWSEKLSPQVQTRPPFPMAALSFPPAETETMPDSPLTATGLYRK